MKKTHYNLKEILINEEGWTFYDTNIKLWRQLYKSIKGKKILDIGCGTGLMMGLNQLFDPQKEILGLEGGDSGEKVWKKRNLKVIKGNIYKLPFKNNYFDTVYSSHVLEHLKKPTLAIKESIRVSKKRVIHIVPEGNVQEKNFGTPHLKIYNRINFLNEFKNLKVKIINYRSIQDTHMNSLFIVIDKI